MFMHTIGWHRSHDSKSVLKVLPVVEGNDAEGPMEEEYFRREGSRRGGITMRRPPRRPPADERSTKSDPEEE